MCGHGTRAAVDRTAAGGVGVRLAVDVGGTFTDLVLISPQGAVATAKVLSTPTNPAAAVLTGVQRILAVRGVAASEIEAIIHATTLMSNAVIERKGAKIALLTTAGFADVLEIGNERRYELYDLFLEMPEPLVAREFRREVVERTHAADDGVLVPRHMRKEIAERTQHDGLVRTPVRAAQIAEELDHLAAEGVEAVAVCFLHSFRNPVHERLVAEVAGRTHPEIAISLSAEVAPEIREYPRTSTTIVNAYIAPLTRRYLAALLRDLQAADVQCPLHIMLSSGGVASQETAVRFPVRLIESGPAAGALAAAFHARNTRSQDVLSFDMGGTTAKACFLESGRPTLTTEFEIARTYRFKRGSGLPIRSLAIELIEIGAGGGSMARVDKLGLLKVGPDSAGASPGPACYGLGGVSPTVTDADLLLGYLDADYFLGGDMRLTQAAAEKAVSRAIAEPLHVTRARAAWGIHEVVNENMASAIRMHAVERGKDLTRARMVAFGGAGPVHAIGIAEKLRVDTIVFPLAAGVGSAFGMLTAPLSYDLVRAYMCDLSTIECHTVDELLRELETEGRRMLESGGLPSDTIRVERAVDARYAGQTFEVTVPLPPGPLGLQSLAQIRSEFEGRYRAASRVLSPEASVECLNWRVRVIGLEPKLGIAEQHGSPRASALKAHRPVYSPSHRGHVLVPVYDRYALATGDEVCGPAIVEERDSTVVLHAGWLAHPDEWGNLVARRRTASRMK